MLNANIKFRLLSWLTNHQSISKDELAQLNGEDWQGISEAIRQHRLAPMLYWQFKQSSLLSALPEDVLNALERSYRQSALRTLTVQRELLLLKTHLSEIETPFVALKGAFLAYFCYPSPGLRPMRDIDLLVPEGLALPAFNSLLDKGYRPLKKMCEGPPENYLAISKHLPPLVSPTNITVEIHDRLFSPDEYGEDVFDPSTESVFWERITTRVIGSHSFSLESPTDLLYHLLIHAVIDHQFNNGPLTLTDIGFLLEKETIDWPLFWELAQRGQTTRSCTLGLQLCERFLKSGGIVWPATLTETDFPASPVIQSAALLMLQDFDRRLETSMGTKLSISTPYRSLAFVLRKLFPRPSVLSALYPVAQHSWKVLLWYPVRWWDLLTKLFPAYLKARLARDVDTDGYRLTQVKQWLSKP